MKNRKKVCVVINNRANYARIKSFLIEAKKNSKIDLKIILGCSSVLDRFGEFSKIIKKDKFKITSKIYSVIEGDTPSCMVKTTGNLMSELANEFSKLRPDFVIVIADRYENLAVAIAAAYMNIPLCHLQGGEVSGSIDESVRHSITKLANYHFACTKRAKDFIIRMGEEEKNVFFTGCPSMDLIKLSQKIPNNFNKLIGGSGDQIDFKKKYIVVAYHPVTTEYDLTISNFKKLLQGIKNLKNKFQIIWLWPNIDAGSDKITKILRKFYIKKNNIKIRFLKNLKNEDYINLITNSSCLVGNSSSGIREGSYIGLPVVNVGSRQNFREKSKNVVDVSYDQKRITNSIIKQASMKKFKGNKTYGNGDAGKKMLKILLKLDSTRTQKKLNYLKNIII